MASTAALPTQNDNVPSSQGGTKKKNKKKKSKASAAAATNATTQATVPAPPAAGEDPESTAPAVPTNSEPDTRNHDDDGDAQDESREDAAENDDAVTTMDGTTEVENTPTNPPKATETNGNGHARNGSTANGHSIAFRPKEPPADDDTRQREDSNGTQSTKSTPSLHTANANANANAKANTDAMTQPDQGALRAEVDQLRQQVKELQDAREAQKGEADQLRAELEESEAGREHAETQYQNLLGRLEKIKETLGDRLKRDRQELEEAKDRVEELEAQNETLRQDVRTAEASAASAAAQVKRLQEDLDDMERDTERETTALRGRAQMAQQNWQREKDELTRQLQQLRAELESTSGAMGEWEVIAMEERSVRETLTDKAADLEEQLASAREQYERAAEEREEQARAIDSLQRALQEIQETRRRELREMVESSEAQLEAAKKRAHEAEAAAETAVAEVASLKQQLERMAPFEREVKEKNLLIGKLRHETIVLNDHLTKALRYIKKNKPEDSVDRQVVTNHVLQFLALDRSDPKKFQVLQIIAGILNWTDEQKEKAGLARPGASGSNLRLPSSPFLRTPSTPSLNAEFLETTPTGSARESLADLWAGFLERSVEEATSEASNPPSRKGSFT